jgi:hypothetical protein
VLIVKGKPYAIKIYFPEVPAGMEPSFTIAVPAGTSFLTGNGEAIPGQLGWFQVLTTIPVAAPDSTVDSQWNITWNYTTITKVMYFEVSDPDLAADEIYQKESARLALTSQDYLARIVVVDSITSGTLVVVSGDTSLYSHAITVEDHRLGKQLSWPIPAEYIQTGELTLLWNTDIIQYYQRLLVAPISLLPVMMEIRFIIDRIVKQLDEPQSYTEADAYVGVVGGISLINGWFPLTAWSIPMFPGVLRSFLVYASAWYMLNSQFVLEGDLAFSYSGQTITLDYDRTGMLESEMSRLYEHLNMHLTKAKLSVLRTAGVLGLIGLTSGPIGTGPAERSVIKTTKFQGIISR